jgi:DNA-binding CsgD family transcriptional regulator
LTERQKLILHYRRQGKSVSEIAEKLGVSQQAISKQLAKIQAVIAEALPETVRAYKGKRSSAK